MRTINKEKIVASAGHVVVLKGGNSVEREISLISGEAVFQGLQRLGIHSTVLDVTDNVVAELIEAKPDLVFIMLHGQGGEDGVIQGLLETMQMAYTGSGVLASALAMDKVKSKLIWQQLGLQTPDFALLDKDTDWQGIIDRFGRVVVKPASGGSSIGIAIASDAKSLQELYVIASKLDSQVMAEKCIVGEEFSVGLIQGELLPAIQMQTKRDFFDFEAKYLDEDTKIICPPDLSEAKRLELNKLVRVAYDSLDCAGLARVDVMQDGDGEFYLLEVNTIPGMTKHSFVPAAAKQIGIGFDELLLRILEAELAPY